MLELALLDSDFSIDGDDACCRGIICGVALQLAVDHLDRGTVKDGDAWYFAVRLTEDATVTTTVND